LDLAGGKTGKAAQEAFPDELAVAPDPLKPQVRPLLAEAGPSSWGSWATATARDAGDGLARQVDVIYVHMDVDILDAPEIPGSFYETPGGPTAGQVARVLEELTNTRKCRHSESRPSPRRSGAAR